MADIREQTSLEKFIEKALYTDRLLVVLECKEGFKQVRLTEKQFKRVSDAVCIKIGKKDDKGLQRVWMDLGTRLISKRIFEGMEDYDEKPK